MRMDVQWVLPVRSRKARSDDWDGFGRGRSGGAGNEVWGRDGTPRGKVSRGGDEDSFCER